MMSFCRRFVSTIVAAEARQHSSNSSSSDMEQLLAQHPTVIVVKAHVGRAEIRRVAVMLDATFASTCGLLTTAIGWPVTSFQYQDFDGCVVRRARCVVRVPSSLRIPFQARARAFVRLAAIAST